MSDGVDHPAYYGGKDNPYEAIKVIEAWQLDFCLGNAVKYIARAGKKSRATELEDLRKARWYIERRIQQIESGRGNNDVRVEINSGADVKHINKVHKRHPDDVGADPE